MANQQQLLLRAPVAVPRDGVTEPTAHVRDDGGIPDSAKPTKD